MFIIYNNVEYHPYGGKNVWENYLPNENAIRMESQFVYDTESYLYFPEINIVVREEEYFSGF